MCIIKKKKLLIIVGAGASVEFDMPPVSAIDTLFDTWCNQILSIPTTNKSLYKHLKDEIENHFRSVTKPIKTDTNFEEVLYTAMNLYSLNNDNKTNPISAFYDFKTMPQVQDQLGTTREVDYNDFKHLMSYLIDELLKEFRNKCQSYKRQLNNQN